MKWAASLPPLSWGLNVFGQTNSWDCFRGGDWHDVDFWSAGVLPGINQVVLIGGTGTKTVRIGLETIADYPETLRVDSLSVSAPADWRSTLLLDSTGTNQFQVRQLHIDEGGELTVANSATALDQFQLRGSATQWGDSYVYSSMFNIDGGGVYNLIEGTFRAVEQNIGSTSILVGEGDDVRHASQPGVFNQYGGTNLVTAHFGSDGLYNLFGGRLQARFHGFTQALILGGTLNQSGGSLDGALVFRGGRPNTYHLSGGLRTGGSVVISQRSAYLSTDIVQTGGTNQGYELRLTPYIDRYGGDVSAASYTLAGGEAQFKNTIITAFATFAQYGGRHTNETLELSGEYVCGKRQPGAYPVCHHGYGRYVLYDGVLESSSIRSGAGGGFAQSGGKLFVEMLGPVSFSLSGGELMVNHLVATSFAQHGGRLVADNIVLKGGFSEDGGTIEHRGWIQFEYGEWKLGAGEQELGPAHLARLPEGVTADYSPAVSFPTNAASVLRFATSSSGEWASNNKLTIRSWNGSFRGGGAHQLRFGEDRHGLTREQVAQIYFQDPARVSGLYPARMLPDGEVVPLPRVLAQSRDAQLSLQRAPGFVLQTSTNVNGPFQDVPDALSASPVQFSDPARFFRLRPEQ